MKKVINNISVSGRLYDISKLAIKTVKNTESKNFGHDYISGSIDIATDDACLNIVTVKFTFQQATYKSGSTNSSYGVLKKIITEGKTVLSDGKDNATMVKVTGGSIGLNDFYTNKGGEQTLVSAKENNAMFIEIVNQLEDESKRNRFECDFLINGTKLIEADEEKNIKEDYLVVKGAVFGYNNVFLPVEFTVHNKGGIDYFQSLEASSNNLVFTKVWGEIKSQTIITKKEQESAFGEPSIVEFTKNIKEWVITGTSKPDAVYEISEDAEKTGITPQEIKKAIADREIYLADVKKRNDEYLASKAANVTPAAVASAPASVGGFNF